MSTAQIRLALRDDLSAMVDIYNYYVRETHHTFDLLEISVDECTGWLRSLDETGPHRLLVSELDGRVVGYATSGALRPKPAYAPSVETTVYVAPDRTGRGIGGLLYSRLLGELSEMAGLHRAYAVIALPNPGSIVFHERFGFTHVGTFREVGRKFDRWWDIAWYEKDLDAKIAP